MRTSTSGHTTDDASAYRLPTTVLPHAYRLTLTPDLGAATFTGEVEIDVTVGVATDQVVLNAAELAITSAEVVAAGGDALAAASVDLDDAEERVALTFGPGLAVGPATLRLAFTGILNDKLRGFYRSTFTDEDGVEHVIATTQMESTDARRAFPCFDEPAFKATFEVTSPPTPTAPSWTRPRSRAVASGSTSARPWSCRPTWWPSSSARSGTPTRWTSTGCRCGWSTRWARAT